MKPKLIIINGPINSGKSTIGKMLGEQLKNSIFKDADYLIDWNEKMEDRERWNRTIDLIIEKGNQITTQNKNSIFAYPISERNFKKIKENINANIELIIITLSPKLEICLINRGTRELEDWELKRIQQHYENGIHKVKHSNLIIDNSFLKPTETTQKIMEFLAPSLSHPSTIK